MAYFSAPDIGLNVISEALTLSKSSVIGCVGNAKSVPFPQVLTSGADTRLASCVEWTTNVDLLPLSHVTACVTNSEWRMQGSLVFEEYNIGVPLNCYDYCKMLLVLQEIRLDLLGKPLIVQNPTPHNRHSCRAADCPFIRFYRPCPCCKLRGVVDAVGWNGENAVEAWDDVRYISCKSLTPTI